MPQACCGPASGFRREAGFNGGEFFITHHGSPQRRHAAAFLGACDFGDDLVAFDFSSVAGCALHEDAVGGAPFDGLLW